MRLSNILGACVCSVYEGKHLGYILNATFSEKYKKVSGFVVVNDDDDYEYFLGAKQIIGQDDDVLFVKNETSISTKNYEEPHSLINKAAYFLDGKFIGKVRDVEIDENFETKEIIFDNITLSIAKLFNVGVDFCFFAKKTKSQDFAALRQQSNLKFQTCLSASWKSQIHKKMKSKFLKKFTPMIPLRQSAKLQHKQFLAKTTK